jgi:hypothetical protein
MKKTVVATTVNRCGRRMPGLRLFWDEGSVHAEAGGVAA